MAAAVSTILTWEDVLESSPAWGPFSYQSADNSGLSVGGAYRDNEEDTQSMIDSPICSRDLSYNEALVNTETEDKHAAPVSTRFKER